VYNDPIEVPAIEVPAIKSPFGSSAIVLQEETPEALIAGIPEPTIVYVDASQPHAAVAVVEVNDVIVYVKIATVEGEVPSL
jgi:hypothetical protein